jgi:hypothetical protein
MKVECRPKYFENEYTIRDYIIAFTFNNKKYGVSYHSNIIKLLVKNPNFNLIFYLIVKLGFYLKELNRFTLSTKNGDNQVYIPMDYCKNWHLITNLMSKLETTLDFSHPDAINDTKINPVNVNNKQGFFLELEIYNDKNNMFKKGEIIICRDQYDKKTYGYHYKKYYSYKSDWVLRDYNNYWIKLLQKLSELIEYINTSLELHVLNNTEIDIIKHALIIIFTQDVKLIGSTFLRGLFNEYQFQDKDEHIIAMNHLKMLDIRPIKFIDNLNKSF